LTLAPATSDEKRRHLFDLLSRFENISTLVAGLLEVWPEHQAYLIKSFEARSEAVMAATESAAKASLILIGPAMATVAADYRWTCDQLRDEELFFHRNGRYRLSTFKEADAEVYSNHDYMSRYVNGLLLTQVLWFNHAATFEMFLNRVLPLAQDDIDYLEVGPGHGLMVYFAAQSPRVRSLEAWDFSAVSLRETQAALDKLQVKRPVSLTEVDILSAKDTGRQVDLIVISEVLEHLERPDTALKFLHKALRPGGHIYINVPINSPSPDHIYLFSNPDEVQQLVEAAGFKIDSMELFATQGRAVERALKDKISVSAGLIAHKA
jgi:2-polyprenyl-3-methyl-5-hydroxy-6-metoxy-1,4-benzoquinol methylase